MREILFRGKQWETGEWFVGSYIWEVFRCFDDGQEIRLISLSTGNGGCHVDPETVSQWTGLVDKNGTKIFEGDIMHCRGNVVGFCNGGFCINGDSPLDLWTRSEVIGNWWDNPELI